MNCTHDFCRKYPHLFIEERLNLIKEDDIHQWFLVNPFAVIALTVSYLTFALVIGPRYMSTRKPFQVKLLIRVYNIFQIIYNANTFMQLFIIDGGLYYLYNYSCHPLPTNVNPLTYNINVGTWMFMLSKAIDLLDTVFFVITRKQDHVTFLHVYHHSVMLASTWYFLKYVQGVQMVLLGLINSFVHVFMYTYYFLSSFGPKMRPYLWWKNYVTLLQMLQFVICGIYLLHQYFKECSVSNVFTIYAKINNFVFLYLFMKFYYETYVKVKQA